jgi:APA family basic amino acid/polyamine antiporter
VQAGVRGCQRIATPPGILKLPADDGTKTRRGGGGVVYTAGAMADQTAPAVNKALARRLGLGTATSVVVANMIGTGIFTTTGFMLAHVGAGWLVVACWMAGGLVALAGALSYAELAVIMPRAGGEYVYLRETYGPLAGFLTGWTSFFVGFSAPIAAAGVAFAKYLAAAGTLPATPAAERLTALVLVAVFTGIHYTGVRLGAPVQNTLTVLKLVLLFGLVAGGFALGDGSAANFGERFFAGGDWSQLGVAMLLTMFAYSGWNAAAYLAEEVREPARTLPRALLLGTLAVMLIYVAFNLLLFFAVPAAELTGVATVGELAARRLFGDAFGRGFALLVAAGLLSSLSAYVFIGPRVYYAMARDGQFFRFAARIHPRFQTPSLSIAAQGVCATAMVLTGAFEQLFIYIGFALGIFPWLTVAAVFVLRRREPGRERPYRVWGYPLVPGFYLATSAAIMAVAFANSPKTSLIAIATVAAGVPTYYLFARKG